MIRLLIRRLLMAVAVIWLISIAVFALFYLAPDPHGPSPAVWQLPRPFAASATPSA